MGETLEYWLVVAIARFLGCLPTAGRAHVLIGSRLRVYHCFGRLRRVGERNLEMALPRLSANTRTDILRSEYLNLGYQLVEFCRMTRYTPENTRELAAYRRAGTLPGGTGAR